MDATNSAPSIDRRVGSTFDKGRSSVCWPLIVPGTACAIIIAHTRVNWASAHAGRLSNRTARVTTRYRSLTAIRSLVRRGAPPWRTKTSHTRSKE